MVQEVLQVANANNLFSFAACGSAPTSPRMFTAEPMQYAQFPQYNAQYQAQSNQAVDPALVQQMSAMQLQAQPQPQHQLQSRPQYQAAYMAQAAAAQSVYPGGAFVVPQAGIQQRSNTLPMYTTSSSGTPINISGGFAQTESRGIFIKNIHFKASAKDVLRVFASVGTIVNSDIPTNPDTGKLRGFGTIQYSSREEAETAVRRYNQREYKNKKLEVRLDKEKTTVVAPASTPSSSSAQLAKRSNTDPVIVDGSGAKSRV